MSRLGVDVAVHRVIGMAGVTGLIARHEVVIRNCVIFSMSAEFHPAGCG